MDTQSRAITAILLAVGVAICGVLYSVLDVSQNSPSSVDEKPWPYTTLPGEIPPYITTPDAIIDFGSLFDLGSAITGPVIAPVRPADNDYPRTLPTLPPSAQPLLPPIEIPPLEIPPVTIPTDELNQVICDRVPTLCATSDLLDDTVDGVEDTVNDGLVPLVDEVTDIL